MTHIVIAQCTDEKRDTIKELPAKEMYMESDLFKAQRRYAEAYADRWYIFSAKYGLISPAQYIPSYDYTLEKGVVAYNQEKIDIFFKNLDEGYCTLGILYPNINKNAANKVDNVNIELICGGEYADRLRTYIEMYDLEYSEPFEGMRIGTRAKKMREEARKVENESIESYA